MCGLCIVCIIRFVDTCIRAPACIVRVCMLRRRCAVALLRDVHCSCQRTARARQRRSWSCSTARARSTTPTCVGSSSGSSSLRTCRGTHTQHATCNAPTCNIQRTTCAVRLATRNTHRAGGTRGVRPSVARHPMAAWPAACLRWSEHRLRRCTCASVPALGWHHPDRLRRCMVCSSRLRPCLARPLQQAPAAPRGACGVPTRCPRFLRRPLGSPPFVRFGVRRVRSLELGLEKCRVKGWSGALRPPTELFQYCTSQYTLRCALEPNPPVRPRTSMARKGSTPSPLALAHCAAAPDLLHSCRATRRSLLVVAGERHQGVKHTIRDGGTVC